MLSSIQAEPGRQEWITVIECICADGSIILPMVIFKGKNLMTSCIPQPAPKGWYFACNTKGWTSNEPACLELVKRTIMESGRCGHCGRCREGGLKVAKMGR